MDIASHIDALRTDGERLADAAVEAGLDATVPHCPGWSVRDLVRHLSGVHRWAATNVTYGRASQEQAAAAFDAPDDDELMAWFRSGHEALVRTLAEASPALEAWSFLPAPSPLAFWARRQAHETAIHRGDAEAAAGIKPSHDASFAADGIDELLAGFMSRSGGRLTSDPGVRLAVAPIEVPRAWTMWIGPSETRCDPRAEAADATVRGSAGDLYEFLWNRLDRDAIEVDGDPAVLDLWRAHANVRWG
jgi:uncharacterized protein (TIGR03083 family)